MEGRLVSEGKKNRRSRGRREERKRRRKERILDGSARSLGHEGSALLKDLLDEERPGEVDVGVVADDLGLGGG